VETVLENTIYYDMRKRVGFITSNPLYKTGFSNNIKTILPILYKKDKYEIFLLCQGTDEHDQNLKRMPWHSEGAIKRGTFNEEFYHKDPGYQRLVSYGNFAVESFITENKLDCVIHIEDGWSSDVNFYLNNKTWWPHFKNNFLNWSTIDSLPVLDIYRRWGAECPNTWFWASFGEKALKKENPELYKNVKTVPGTLNLDDYSPISENRKMELREKFGIDKDTKLFIQLGRNQLRKLYPFTLEAFSLFKKRNPEFKAKLLFHCSWSETGGWPLEKLIKDFGLENSDVLTTYYCRMCGQYEIKPFCGEDKDCQYCKTPKSQITAGIASAISNKELSEIYGICDASVSPFTSGGLEYHNVQSLLCGLPLLCSNYSCGEDFLNNGIVFELDGTFTFECGTGFKKHVPNPNTMQKFFRTICSSNPQRLKEIGQKGRAWALEKFDTNKVINELEKFIDNAPEITWDYQVIQGKKNPDYQNPNIEDDTTWLKDLYKNILNMDVGDNDKGLLGWREQIDAAPMDKKAETRHLIYLYFIKTAKQENEKVEKITLDKFFEGDDKKMLFVLPGSIGDIFITTSLFESAKEIYPDHKLYVATQPQYFSLLDGNPYVDKVVPYMQEFESEMFMCGAGNHNGFVDVLYLPFCGTQKILNYLSINKVALELE
jgi:glycosyltransferase involved in cell wall biosynthesis